MLLRYITHATMLTESSRIPATDPLPPRKGAETGREAVRSNTQ